MNPDQDNNVFRTGAAIAEHLSLACTYATTLRGLQQYARECLAILERNGHFIATITYAMWDSLILALSHCSDSGKEATGFPKLFKQLRKYVRREHELFPQIQAQEQRLRGLNMQRKVENWRNNVVAHRKSKSNFATFYKQSPISLDEIEQLIDELLEILHEFSTPLWMEMYDLSELVQESRRGVDQLVASMKTEAGLSLPQPTGS
jgi:hypothetical protein